MTKTDKLRCVERELRMRKKVYPRWIAEGRMTQQQAEHEIDCMAAIAADYDKIVHGERLI
jgi:hypothetical protein